MYAVLLMIQLLMFAITTCTSKLKNHSGIAVKWFEDNYTKINSDKCHLFISGLKFKHFWTTIENDKIWGTGTVKFLSIPNYR